MSEEPNDGGPAFPAMTPGGYCTPGMSLRDWFAGQALAGMLANEHLYCQPAADDAYKFADAMLAAREPSTAPQIALGIGGAE